MLQDLLLEQVWFLGVTYKMFRGFQMNINILAISTSEIKLSVIIEEDNTLKAIEITYNF